MQLRNLLRKGFEILGTWWKPNLLTLPVSISSLEQQDSSRLVFSLMHPSSIFLVTKNGLQQKEQWRESQVQHRPNLSGGFSAFRIFSLQNRVKVKENVSVVLNPGLVQNCLSWSSHLSKIIKATPCLIRGGSMLCIHSGRENWRPFPDAWPFWRSNHAKDLGDIFGKNHFLLPEIFLTKTFILCNNHHQKSH